ncbi:hypothetical protein RFI_05440 [Reticulomyxa filosa]|uniref:Uncharacterized protein n=1 Tax=Reticulomyxa filosa TaxID=46433 RepID=X6P0B6_RETFI|nr:hypothetical protein RFI_05440 [Reticulomyxa filosa]|eukprot:ETO31681.1 hypothetical protein RFI_05440 [Reticulomyxa filosa]
MCINKRNETKLVLCDNLIATFGYSTAEGLIRGNKAISSERLVIGSNSGEMQKPATVISNKEERTQDIEKSNKKEEGQTPLDSSDPTKTSSQSKEFLSVTAGAINKQMMNEANNDPSKEPSSNNNLSQLQKYDLSNKKESGVPSVARTDNALPLWFYHGFNLYKTKYNPGVYKFVYVYICAYMDR